MCACSFVHYYGDIEANPVPEPAYAEQLLLLSLKLE